MVYFVRFLGYEINKFINENWREAEKDIAPTFMEILKMSVQTILNGFTQEVPNNEIFLS